MKTFAKFLTVMAVIPFMAGCNNQQGGDIEVTDLQNRTVSINTSKLDRVICLGAGALRMYSYIGDMNKVVATEDIDGKNTFGVGTALRPYYLANQEYLSTLPSCGKGGPMNQAPDYELLLANKPDIIVSLYSDPSVNDTMSQTLGVPVIALSQGNDAIFDDSTIASFNLLGKVFNRQSRADELVKYINDSKAELDKLTLTTETNYAGCIGNWGKTNLYGSYYQFPVFKYAKVTNAIDNVTWPSGAKQVTVDAEKLVELNPDRIFVDGAGFAGFLTDYKANKDKYSSLKAIQNNEVYSLLPYNAYYTNLEIQLISTYYVASLSHASDFVNFNIENKANEVTKKFLGKELYAEMLKNDTSLGGYQKLDLEELSK